ncbi:tetratricopeptide repeat protein [Chlorobium sp. N1]|uniref:tetratricopeptide repeat protein n=1 Tax=Chlorobium sp. N1 TaxID=2491138 RepID=UPI00103B1102|nr:tetratricopeptide repeat protein [Chlorobium sp. N1]TCD48562.1 tetratricopeptide repeat protein [Chlorobium sp. N1]
MKKRWAFRIIIAGGLVLLTAGLLYFGFTGISDFVRKTRNEQALNEAGNLLEEGRLAQAFDIIRMHDRSLPDTQKKWLHLEIEALHKLGNIGRLQALFAKDPRAFEQHEEASMMMCRALLARGELKEYQALRQTWENRKSRPGIWFALDVDALLIQGDRAGAIKLLKEHSLEGEADAARLTRLAILTAPGNMPDAWRLLEQAYRIAPRNPDVRSFRGQILERMGRRQMARVEYVAAHLAMPENPLYREQLAEFYRRGGQLKLALQSWSRDLNDHSADFIRLKALFWSKMAAPATIEKADKADLFGQLTPVVLYLQELPEGVYWDEKRYNSEVNAREAFIEQRQEIFWLRIVQLLKDGEEENAYNLILSHPFKRSSWNPDIERAIEQVLAFRLEHPQPIDIDSFFSALQKGRRRHQLFTQLESMANGGKSSPELARLMKSREAFAAVFMAGGWIEAALQLHAMEKIPDDFPDWVAYGMTQSLRFNRGNSEALAFARKQPETESLKLLSAELMLANNEADAGIAELETLTSRNSAIGYRAAWLLSLARLEKKEPQKARAALESQPALSQSTAGREIRARILLAEGKTAEARGLYESIADASNEARGYLAKVAFREQELEKARKLTLELQREFPDNMQLRRNLMTIEKAEADRSK